MAVDHHRPVPPGGTQEPADAARPLTLTRRQIFRLAALIAVAARTGGAPVNGQASSGERLSRSSTRVKGFDDPEMDFQLMRQLGAAAGGGASVGECLAVARRIRDGDPVSWSQEFSSLAARQEEEARRLEAAGHRLSAMETYLRASNSYRAAEYFTPFADPRHRALGLKSRLGFIAAMSHAAHGFEEVFLPFGEARLPAYWFSPERPAGPARTLLIISGFDGTLEESYFMLGRAALARGYFVLHFAGPGQMDTMRFYPQLPFIPDYERVASLAVDHVLARQAADPQRVALCGISWGGYFCIRAAAHDPRIRAVVPNSPIVDLHAYLIAFAGFDPAEMPDDYDFSLADLSQIPDDVLSPVQKVMTAMLIARLGRQTFKKTYQHLRSFRVTPEQLAKIRVPALALVGAGEGEEPLRQFEQFCRQVSGPVTTRTFTAEEGADSHAQVGNLALAAGVILDWLDGVFA